jgi:hypothetical protein
MARAFERVGWVLTCAEAPIRDVTWSAVGLVVSWDRVSVGGRW